MGLVTYKQRWWAVCLTVLLAAAMALGQDQQTTSQSTQNPKKTNDQSIPDAPSASQPPQPFPSVPSSPVPPAAPPASKLPPNQPAPGDNSAPPSTMPSEGPEGEPMPPVTTIPKGSAPGTPNSRDELFTLRKVTNQVLVPVTVKDPSGFMVDGLLPRDFSVYENGVRQRLNFFTSDPFPLSAAVVFDLGMPDVTVQKVYKTFPALEGAFSRFDEISFFTYSSNVSQLTDFTAVGKKLEEVLAQLQTATGNNNGPPVVSGPFGPQGPTVNGVPVDQTVPHVITPPRQAHVLNDALLAAALDLSKRPRERRKVILLISDGREYGSQTSYKDVLKVLLSNGITVYALGVDTAGIPGYSRLQRLHIPREGYGNILPKYVSATGGGEVFGAISASTMEDVYARITREARNQYTLGYIAHGAAPGTYHQIEVRIDRPNLKVYAKDGYYPLPPGR